MPTAQFIHHGDAIDYVPESDVSAGDVIVLNDLIGVAKRDHKAGELAAIAVVGVFDFPKATGGGTAIPLGTVVYWDATAQQVTTVPGGGEEENLGKTVLPAGDDDAMVRVRLRQ